MSRVIRLPNGRAVPLRTYVEKWRGLRSLPPATLVAGFDHFPLTAAQVLDELRRGLHDRINQRGGLRVPPTDIDWERDLRDVRGYRERRLVLRGSGLRTARARRRFPDVHAAMTERDHA